MVKGRVRLDAETGPKRVSDLLGAPPPPCTVRCREQEEKGQWT